MGAPLIFFVISAVRASDVVTLVQTVAIALSGVDEGAIGGRFIRGGSN
ncbi:hypothetical protein JCM19233_4439 [Vibrio astriarenae]|nr:hypothetical protein JCM19233_4439 [Vibrio sp. C7]